MKLIKSFILLFLLLSLTLNCYVNDEEPEEINKECLLDMTTVDLTFGIDHEQPELYLVHGEQSQLSDIYLTEIIETLGESELNLQYINKLCEWVNSSFNWEIAGGAMIGELNVDELYKGGKLYGCHSAALVICGALRGLGFPVVMIETASIDWAYDQYNGTAGGMIGHVMNEIFVDEHWILLDNNGEFINSYDPHNPYISTNYYPIKDLWVIAKGLDTWDYFEKTTSDTHNLMMDFAENIYCFEQMFYTVDYQWSN